MTYLEALSMKRGDPVTYEGDPSQLLLWVRTDAHQYATVRRASDGREMLEWLSGLRPLTPEELLARS